MEENASGRERGEEKPSRGSSLPGGCECEVFVDGREKDERKGFGTQVASKLMWRRETPVVPDASA